MTPRGTQMVTRGPRSGEWSGAGLTWVVGAADAARRCQACLAGPSRLRPRVRRSACRRWSHPSLAADLSGSGAAPGRGMTRRMLAVAGLLAGGVLAAAVLAGAMSDAVRSRAAKEEALAANALVQARVEAGRMELESALTPAFRGFAARSFGYGRRTERPFQLAAGCAAAPVDRAAGQLAPDGAADRRVRAPSWTCCSSVERATRPIGPGPATSGASPGRSGVRFSGLLSRGRRVLARLLGRQVPAIAAYSQVEVEHGLDRRPVLARTGSTGR